MGLHQQLSNPLWFSNINQHVYLFMLKDKVARWLSEVNGNEKSEVSRMEQPVTQPDWFKNCTKTMSKHFGQRNCGPVFTWLESNRLWYMVHLWAEGMHCFSPKFECSIEQKLTKCWEEIEAETRVIVTCDLVVPCLRRVIKGREEYMKQMLYATPNCS